MSKVGKSYICFNHDDKPFLDRMVGPSSIRFPPFVPVEVTTKDAEFLTSRYRFAMVKGDPEKYAWKNGAWKRGRLIVSPNLSIGDTLLAIPAMAALARSMPWMKMTVAAHPLNAGLFRNMEWCDEFISVWELNSNRHKYVSVREYALINWAERSPLMKTVPRTDIYAKKMGVVLNGYNIPMVQPDLDLADQYGIPWKKHKAFVVIQPRSFSPLRTWDWHWKKEGRFPKAEILARKLAGAGYGVIITGSREWKCFDGVKGIYNICGKTKNSEQVAAVVKKCKVAICCGDSGMVHLAGFLRVPFVGIFGPIDPALRVNRYKVPHHAMYKKTLKCANCQEQTGDCKRPCMDFTVGQVYKKAIELVAIPHKEDQSWPSQPKTRKPSSSATSTSTSARTRIPAPTRGRKSRSRSALSSPSS